MIVSHFVRWWGLESGKGVMIYRFPSISGLLPVDFFLGDHLRLRGEDQVFVLVAVVLWPAKEQVEVVEGVSVQG